jgi:hypothetical protein
MTDAQLLAIAAARTATTPEAVISGAIGPLFATLGDRQAHLRPGALDPGQTQYFVGGAFFVTPDRRHQMLVGSTGFPPEQRRLLIPIDGGDPGRVITSASPLLIEDTRLHPGFRQYLKTSRMSSAIYAPLIRDEAAIGLLILAAQAGNTFGQADLDALVGIAPAVLQNFDRCEGAKWLAAEYQAVVADNAGRQT